jgi:hypothetical protein
VLAARAHLDAATHRFPRGVCPCALRVFAHGFMIVVPRLRRPTHKAAKISLAFSRVSSRSCGE